MAISPDDPRRVAGHDDAATMPASGDEVEARFRALVRSPLRAGLLRFLAAQPGDSFDLETLMSTLGRLRLDVENCLRELVEFGVARRLQGPSPRYTAARPTRETPARLLD